MQRDGSVLSAVRGVRWKIGCGPIEKSEINAALFSPYRSPVALGIVALYTAEGSVAGSALVACCSPPRLASCVTPLRPAHRPQSMGANVSRDGVHDQEAHPMRLARLGSRPGHPNGNGNGGAGVQNPYMTPPRLGDIGALPPPPHPLAHYPHDVRFLQHRSPVQRSGIVANVVNLDKTTLRVVPAPPPHDPRVLCLEFEFTANVPGFVAVYYAARRMVHRASGVSAPVRKVSYIALDVEVDDPSASSDGAGTVRRKAEKTRFEPGTQLQYRQKATRGLRTHLYPEDVLTEVVDGVQYPVVIRIEARHNAKTPKRTRVTAQSTHAVLTRNNGRWGIKVVSQEVLIGGTIYVVQELYGIGAVDVTASRSDALATGTGVPNVFDVDKGNECVICLTETANTAVLPCNHLCLCQECGAKLSEDPAPDRRRCPICRTEIESLLRIIPTSLGTNRSRELQLVPPQPVPVRDLVDVEVEPLSSGEGEVSESAAVEPTPNGTAPPPQTPPNGNTVAAPTPTGIKVEDEASISSEVSDSSSRDEDGAIVTLQPATAQSNPHAHAHREGQVPTETDAT